MKKFNLIILKIYLLIKILWKKADQNPLIKKKIIIKDQDQDHKIIKIKISMIIIDQDQDHKTIKQKQNKIIINQDQDHKSTKLNLKITTKIL